MFARLLVLLLGAVLAALVSPASGRAANVQWFPVPTPDSELIDIATGADGNVWFTEEKGMEVGRITPAGQITEFPGTTADATEGFGPTDIVAGADGQLWFLTEGRSKLGRLDPVSGAASVVFDNDLYRMQTLGAAAGGGVWLTFNVGTDADSPDDGVVRVRTDGTPSRLPAKYLGDLTPIVGAADGAGWYGDGGKTIFRVTETGETSAFPLEPQQSLEEVASVAFDKAGTLWFTTYKPGAGFFSSANGGSIGRVVDGKAVVTPLRDASLPRSLQLGPDGAMWFVVKGGIGRVDADGTVTVAPVGADINAMTFAPDGSIWVVDSAGNRVGKVAVDAALFPIGKGARPAFRVLGKLQAARRARALDVRCTLPDPGSCAVRATVSRSVARSLRLGKTRTLGSGTTSGKAAGEVKVRVRLSKKAVRALGRVRKKVEVTLSVTVRGPQRLSSTKKTVTLRR